MKNKSKTNFSCLSSKPHFIFKSNSKLKIVLKNIIKQNLRLYLITIFKNDFLIFNF